MICENFSLLHICRPCQATHLTSSLFKRKISNNIEVISFYEYEDIKDFLLTKHTDLGYYIYSIMAQNSFALFAKEFAFSHAITSIAVDDKPSSGYSHTALLNRHLQSKFITPAYAKLRAKNDVKYAGKSRDFRLANPRGFTLAPIKTKEVILVDDIITTGTTLSEAIFTCQKAGIEVLFCLTLATAKIQ